MRRARWNVGAAVLIALAAIAGTVLFVLRSSFRGMGAEGSEVETLSSTPNSRESSSTSRLEAVGYAETSPAQTNERALPDGVWIRGRVIVPAGTPSDERVEIAARVLSFDDAPGYVAEMGADGTFAVMFPKEVDSGWIEVHARYLVLEPNQAVDLEEPPEEVVLEPVLGGRVRGRIVAPARGETRVPAGTCVELSANTGPGFRRFHPRRMLVGENLRFEFQALPPIAGYELAMKAKDFLPFEKGFEIPPGTTTEVEIELHAGVRVSGRVLDADGKPVEGAVVWKTENPPREDPRRADADALSGPNGSFAMTAIPPGDVSISFKADGWLREIVPIGRLEDGDVRAGIEVRLRPGLVHGRVEWPDGRPAFDAVVELDSWTGGQDGRTFTWSEPIRRQVYNGGRFAIEAISEGPFFLAARSPRESDIDPDDESAVSESGVVLVEGVRPGSAPIVLVLEASQILRGRVTDDLGNPVTGFMVEGRRRGQESMPHFLTDSAIGRFEHPDGTFALAGLARGSWTFEASVDERGSRSSHVELPNQGVPIVLVIPRCTTVSGTVVDPDGHPVAGAEVHSPSRFSFHSDEDGSFEVEDLPAGPLEIWAEARSFAPSEHTRLQVDASGSASGVRLVLRRGGTIVCEVLDAEGHPEPHRRVAIQMTGREWYRRGVESEDEPGEKSDENGRLVIEDLAPGAYSLSKIPTYQELNGKREAGPNLWTRLATSRTQASVDVVEGEVSHVVIGGPKGSPIRVRGRVTDGGTPMAGIDVRTWAMEPFLGEQVGARTDADGRFEFFVSEPGDLGLSLALAEDSLLLRTSRRIGGGSGEDLDLVLPRGRISGIVRSSDDRPLDGADITIASDEIASCMGTWTADAWTRSAGGGRFSFQHLPRGRYELMSVVETLTEDDAGPTTEVTLEEGGHLDDVVLRLP